MKGLLHRLAARATGTALPIRSDTRLPFAKPKPLLEERADVVAVPARTQESALRSQTSAPVRTAPVPAQLLTPHARADALPPRPIPDRSAQAPSPTDSRETPKPAAAESPVTAHVPAAAEASAQPPPTPSNPDAQPRSRTREVEARETSRLPQRLMPPTASERSRPESVPAAAARVSAVTQPTEVHLHVGRIEVAAIVPAPAPRRAARSTPAAMPLEAYLGKRHK